jgi:hypothetical protein
MDKASKYSAVMLESLPWLRSTPAETLENMLFKIIGGGAHARE